ncbi:hypothetical protein [Polaribacter sp. HL-MS24]|uniref:hypothetical protein n=1 Tax=Polaribacter sp. HL-MS24 TaxID=3077735 RepID=UPI0029345508|nr:hypothetical protein [Polaribacter sp. HL-MS24]WOC39282.1 hypothetical protein RRF69_06190 [Polaribacter sp. HL-MS24]
MKNILLRPHQLRNEPIILIQFPFDKELIGCVKTTLVYTHLSKKSLANIQSPLDRIIEDENTVNQLLILKNK